MNVRHPLVSIIDDDESVRESLPDLLREFGCRAEAFSSAEQFLGSGLIADTNCLVLDINMPGMKGPDLERELARRGQSIPIIYVTALRPETVRPDLLKSSAVDCLSKPFSDTALQRALNLALNID